MAPRSPLARLRRALLVALLGAAALAPGVARADSVADTDAATRARLKALFKSGKAHYNLGEFKEALEDFKAAYRTTPDPVFLFNIAQTQREMGDHEAALRSFQLYAREVRSPRDRADAERLIADEERILAAKRSAAAAAAAAAAAPPSHPPDGAPARSGEAAGRAGSARGTAPPAAVAPVAPSPASGEGASRRGTFIALGVTGGLVLAGGAVALGVLLTRPTAPDAPFGTYTAEFR